MDKNLENMNKVWTSIKSSVSILVFNCDSCAILM